jgi:hypothetical protein
LLGAALLGAAGVARRVRLVFARDVASAKVAAVLTEKFVSLSVPRDACAAFAAAFTATPTLRKGDAADFALLPGGEAVVVSVHGAESAPICCALLCSALLAGYLGDAPIDAAAKAAAGAALLAL